MIKPSEPPQSETQSIPSDQAIEYIAEMLGELSEMAQAANKPDLADLIRFTYRAAIMQAP